MALTQEQYLSLFLDQSDLPHMRNVQDTRVMMPNPNDGEWSRNNGLAGGRSIWLGPEDATIWQFMDIRFAFPDAARAAAYHRARLGFNAEGSRPVLGAPAVGSFCAVFGGLRQNPIEPAATMTNYYYLFVVDCVVVKLFVAQSPKLVPGTLTAQDLTPLAQRVEARVTAQLQRAAEPG
jgi:hypothetical protein